MHLVAGRDLPPPLRLQPPLHLAASGRANLRAALLRVALKGSNSKQSGPAHAETGLGRAGILRRAAPRRKNVDPSLSDADAKGVASGAGDVELIA